MDYNRDDIAFASFDSSLFIEDEVPQFIGGDDYSACSFDTDCIGPSFTSMDSMQVQVPLPKAVLGQEETVPIKKAKKDNTDELLVSVHTRQSRRRGTAANTKAKNTRVAPKRERTPTRTSKRRERTPTRTNRRRERQRSVDELVDKRDRRQVRRTKSLTVDQQVQHSCRRQRFVQQSAQTLSIQW